MRRRFSFDKNRELEDFLIRFYPAGNYTWTVPAGCREVDVFLVGGGGGSGYNGNAAGAGGGYTKTFKKDTTGWKDGDAIPVTPGQAIPIIVGAGGNVRANGGYSQFLNISYRANGGYTNNKGWDNSGNGLGEMVDLAVVVMKVWEQQVQEARMEETDLHICMVLIIKVKDKAIRLETLENRPAKEMQEVVLVPEELII